MFALMMYFNNFLSIVETKLLYFDDVVELRVDVEEEEEGSTSRYLYISRHRLLTLADV